MREQIKELKPCPFCGENDECYENLRCGTVATPDAFWDSAMRGEYYGYVKCYECGCILKANSLEEAIEIWNARKERKNE